MIDGASSLEKLQRYLQQLSPATQDRLLTELEHASLRGDDLPGGGLVLDHLRALRRKGAGAVPASAAPAVGRAAESNELAARLFFRPLDPFLVDSVTLGRVHIGRSGLPAMWRWVCHEAMPDEAQRYVEAIEKVQPQDEATREAACEPALSVFHDTFVLRAGELLAAAEADDRRARRIGSHCGLPRGLADLGEVVLLVRERATLATFALGLPAHIANFSDEPFNRVRRLFERLAPIRGPLHAFLITLAMGRLAAPWQIVRLATAMTDERFPDECAATPYADAFDVVLDDLERQAALLHHDMVAGLRRNALGRLRVIHDGLRGLRSEAELPLDGVHGRRLAQIRREAGAALRPDLEQVGPRLRRLLKFHDISKPEAAAIPDGQDVAQIEGMIEIAEAARHYGGELAVSELASRAWSDVAQCLDSQTRALIEVLRTAGESERTRHRARVDAAVRLSTTVYGPDHTIVLRKAADVAETQSRSAEVPARTA